MSVEAAIATVAHARDPAPPLPTFAQIEVVGQCNLRCRMCAIQFRRDGPPHGPNAFMAFDDYRRIVEGFPALERLQLQGLGEPMMHPQFFAMVSWAAARGIRVSTNSNLTLLSRRRALECVETGLAELHVSLDAATPEIYERIRVGASFHKVLRNLRRVMDARAATASALAVRIVAVLMRENLAELPALVRLAASEGVPDLFVQYLCHDFEEASLPEHYKAMRSFIDAERLDRRHAGRVDAVYAQARALAAELGVSLRLPPRGAADRASRPHPRCDWPWQGAYVSYRGDAMPCCMVGTPDRARFGNVLDDGVAVVWHNGDYRRFRSELAAGRPPPVCRSCAVYQGRF
jgi:MoaA/NifB/PqqE/SkfB family radical SAM enzyme